MSSDSPPPDDIEYEFGNPFPGRILAPEAWVQTAWKRLPEGLIDWFSVYGRQAPVVVDLGCGNGRSVLAHAVRRPEANILGVDILPVVIRYATRRANQRGMGHVRFAVIGGRELLEKHTPAGTIDEIHCYHPQPYYRKEEIGKRLITPEFLTLVCRALSPGGQFVIQTDHPAYWAYIQAVVPLFMAFRPHPDPWPDGLRSRRETIAKGQGLSIFRGVGTRRLDWDEAQAREQARQLPPPIFNADRRLRETDAIEAGRRPQQRGKGRR